MTLLRARPREAAAPPLAQTVLSFAIIIPTYNEREDIAATLDAALAQTVRAQIVVVDGGSTDGTLDVVRRSCAGDGVRVIAEGSRRGVAAARNAGMRAAAADIIVFLNADVLLPPDFLERLLPVYAEGADAMSVESCVENSGDATGRYIQAMHEAKYGPRSVGWTEGFSCRRELALAAGFPEEIPGAGGEDVVFLDRLRRAGCRWIVDYTIEVRHRVPATLPGFFAQFRGRGRAVPYGDHRIRNQPLALVVLRRAGATAFTLASALLIVPNAIAVARLARRSPRGMRDFTPFWAIHHVLYAAHRLGEWESVRELMRSRRRP